MAEPILKHGAYYAKIRENGKQKWVRLGDADMGIRAARTERDKLMADRARGTAVLTDKASTVATLFAAYLDHAATRTRPRTLARYHQLYDQHVGPRLGSMPLAGVSGQVVQRLYSDLLKGGRIVRKDKDGKEIPRRTDSLSPRTVGHIHALLRQAFNFAVRLHLLPRSPIADAQPPTVPRQEHTIVDADGVAQLLAVASRSRYAPLVTLAVYSGARRSELLALRRRDVDLDAGTILITRTLHRLSDGTFDLQPTKSAKSRRTVALPPAAVNTLRGHIERLEADLAALGQRLTLDRLLFANVDGSPLNPDLLSGAFRKIAAKAGVQGLSLHDARHSHASILARAGVDPRSISERLGHASVAFTFEQYVHAFADADVKAAAVYGGLVDTAVAKRAGAQTVDKVVDKPAVVAKSA